MPERYKDEIRKLLEANRDVVANTDKELGQTETVHMKIDSGDHLPIRLMPYRTPIHKRKLVEEAVSEMLDSGVIERSRPPPWSFPIVIVEKKDGGHRFCVDFKQLNSITKLLAVPLLNDILALLGRSTLDLRSVYW